MKKNSEYATETIELLVTVKITFPNESTVIKYNKNRKIAVNQAKRCVTSQSMHGLTSVIPLRAKEV